MTALPALTETIEVADPRTGEIVAVPSVVIPRDLAALVRATLAFYARSELSLAEHAALLDPLREIIEAAKHQRDISEFTVLLALEAEGAKAKRIGADLYKVEERVDWTVTDIDELLGFLVKARDDGEITPDEFGKAVEIVPARPKFDHRALNALARRGGLLAQIDRLRAAVVASRRLKKEEGK